jgi:uncharacterized membrane-anchored protein YitT (DUF2179 family)
MHSFGRVGAVIIGAAFTALSLEFCYIPHRLLDGGMTGAAVLFARSVHLSPVHVLFVLNALAVLYGSFYLGRSFLEKTAVGFMTLGICLAVIGPLPPLLPALPSAIAGGIGIGLGVGLVLRAGGVLDGSEMMALVLHRSAQLSIVRFLTLFNLVVFIAAVAMMGLSNTLLSILAQGTALTVLSLLVPRRHV